MADVIETLVGALPKHNVTGLRISLTHRSAVIVVQGIGVRPIRVDAHAANIVVHPIHKARTIEATIAIQVFAAPHIGQADILFGIYQNICKRRTRVVPCATEHAFGIGSRQLLRRKKLLGRSVNMSGSIRRRSRGISARNDLSFFGRRRALRVGLGIRCVGLVLVVNHNSPRALLLPRLELNGTLRRNRFGSIRKRAHSGHLKSQKHRHNNAARLISKQLRVHKQLQSIC